MTHPLTPHHFLPHVQKVFHVEGGAHALTLTQRFEPVPTDERAFLEQAVARVSEYNPGDCFVNEGDSPSESCLVVKGFASRVKTLPSGTRQIMALHIAGDFCDLHSFSLRKMDHSIAAVSRCKIAKVPHANIAEIIERFPRLVMGRGR
jgi:CRP-like cAMP-binding protein